MSKPLFVFAGGGTGGHIFPGLAVATSLKQSAPRARLLFTGTNRAVEQSILRDTGFDSLTLQVPPIATLPAHPFRFMSGHLKDWSLARQLVAREHPACVIGLGGLASLAVSCAAGRRGIPVILLEQNVIPGRATRRLARRFPVCTSFEETSRYLSGAKQIICTGNPLRTEITELAGVSATEIANRNTLLI
ncbi:MAG: glycosyltransferase, partial [Planctomycetaceae bacterium]